MDRWILSVLVFLPSVVGMALTLVPREREEFIRRVALLVTLVVLALATAAYGAYDGEGFDFICDTVWIPQLHIHYKVGADGIALAMILLTAFLTVVSLLCSWHAIKDRAKGFFISVLLLESGMIGVFSALDLFLFYVFWEAMLVPMVLLIGIWGGARRIYAAMKFLLYTVAGSLLMFVAILYVYFRTREFPEGPTFDVFELQRLLPVLLTDSVQNWLFLAFAVAFAIKVPLFPFHTWLPDAHTEAPTAGSVLLAGVLLKMGAYGFLRFAIPFFPMAADGLANLFVILSVVGILYGALMAMAQSDIKKLIAYSSVSHMGFVLLGIFSFTLNSEQGAVLQMVNHGLSTGMLFLLVGFLYERTHRRALDDFGGLAKVTPKFAAFFMIAVLSSIGLPGLNGFVGEFLVLVGTFEVSPTAAAFAVLGVILSAVYLLRPYRDIFFGPVRMRYPLLKDVSRSEWVYLLPVAFIIILLGIQPNLVLSKTQTSVSKVVKTKP